MMLKLRDFVSIDGKRYRVGFLGRDGRVRLDELTERGGVVASRWLDVFDAVLLVPEPGTPKPQPPQPAPWPHHQIPMISFDQHEDFPSRMRAQGFDLVNGEWVRRVTLHQLALAEAF